MSERPKPQDHKEALKIQLDELIGANEAIATGMLGIGVGIGWDDEGQQGIEKETPWWRELPANESVEVLVAAKAVGLENLPKSIGERRTQALALALHSEAVDRIRGFMEKEQEVFGSIDSESVGEMRALGYLSMAINPTQCDSLMQSGLVESIAPNTKLKVDLL